MEHGNLLLFACGLLLNPTMFSQQVTASRTQHCFSLHPFRDSSAISGPNVLRVYSRTQHWDVRLENGHFCLRDTIADSQYLDVSFRLGDDRFYISSVPIGKFTSNWNFYFGGEKFAALHGLPKSTPAAKSCIIEYNEGEPGTATVVSPCRQ